LKHEFSSPLADIEYKRKMDPKSDEGIFLGYSTNGRAYKVFNSRTKIVMESINVVIDDASVDRVPNVEPEPDVETSVQETNAPTQVNESQSKKKEIEQAEQDHVSISKGPSIRFWKNHSQDLIIGSLDQVITTKRSNEVISSSCFVSKLEPKNVKEDRSDKLWIDAMQEELNQFKRSEVWDLVRILEGINVIGTKWIYKNKSD